MPELVVDQRPIHYTDVGDDAHGGAVVCLHSTGLASFQWRRLARRAAKAGHRVLCPDLLGYGESARWPEARVFEVAADDAVVQAICRLVDGPVHLVGHSYGGRLALRAALDPALRPRVRTVCVYEPVAFGVLRSMDDAEGLADLESYDHDGRFLDPDFGGSEAWMERFVDYWSGSGAWAEMSDAQRSLFMTSAKKVFEEVATTVHDDVPVDAYRELDVPTLLMCGAASRASGRRVCSLLADAMPRGTLRELEEGVHMSPLLHADDVNDPFLQFIADRS